MKKTNIVIIILLLCSIAVNIFIWLDLRGEDNSASILTNRDQLAALNLELAEISESLTNIAKEQRWIQESSFVLDKEESHRENIILTASFTFNQLNTQTLAILYRAKGGGEWLEETLAPVQGQQYATKILVSPFNEYEYQVRAYGEQEITSAIALIPYKVYGLPRWSTDLKFSFANNSNAVEFTIFVLTGQNPPLPEMQPARVQLRVESALAQPEAIDFTMEKGDTGAWSTKWTLPDISVVNEIQAYIDVTYENGLQLSEPFQLLNDRVTYEMEHRTTGAAIPGASNAAK